MYRIGEGNVTTNAVIGVMQPPEAGRGKEEILP